MKINKKNKNMTISTDLLDQMARMQRDSVNNYKQMGTSKMNTLRYEYGMANTGFIEETFKKKKNIKKSPSRELAKRALAMCPPKEDFYKFFMAHNSTKCEECPPKDREDVFMCEECWEAQLV